MLESCREPREEETEHKAFLNICLFSGAYAGVLKIVIDALNKGAEIDARNPYYMHKTALLIAMENNHKSVVQELIKRGAEPRIRDLFGLSAEEYLGFSSIHKDIRSMIIAAVRAKEEALDGFIEVTIEKIEIAQTAGVVKEYEIVDSPGVFERMIADKDATPSTFKR